MRFAFSPELRKGGIFDDIFTVSTENEGGGSDTPWPPKDSSIAGIDEDKADRTNHPMGGYDYETRIDPVGAVHHSKRHSDE